MAQRLGILTALDPEAALVRRLCDHTAYHAVSVGALWQGQVAGLDVVLLRCGMGAERAAQGAAWLAQHTVLWGLLSVGFAGGLQPSLRTGEVILATHIMMWRPALTTIGQCDSAVVVPDPCLRQCATIAVQQAGVGGQTGSLLSVPTVITTVEAKQHLGRLSGALAVDMESYRLGQVAKQHRLVFMTLRSIFDTATEVLPFHAEAFTTPTGRVHLGRFGQYLWRHPSRLAHMPHAWWQARRAGHSLYLWLQSFLTLLADNRKDRWH